MGSFKKSGLTNCDKILKFANFENGGGGVQIFGGTYCMLCIKYCQFLYC